MSSDNVGDAREVGQLLCDFDLYGRDAPEGERQRFVDAVTEAFTRLVKASACSSVPGYVAVFRGRRVWGSKPEAPLSRRSVWVTRVFVRYDPCETVIDLEELLRELPARARELGSGTDICGRVE